MADSEATSSTEAFTCTVCGRCSTLREAFTIGRDGTVAHTWCPLCAERHASKIGAATMVCWLALLAFGWFPMYVEPHGTMPAVVFGLTVFYLSRLVMTLPHELGHACVARLVGFRPIAILIGRGRWLIDRDVFGLRLRVGRDLRGGITLLDVHECSGHRWRMIAIVAAGSLVNGVCGGAALWLAWYAPADSVSPQVTVAALGFTAANLAAVFGNLWPHTTATVMGRRLNDGALLLKYLQRRSLSPIRAQRAVAHLHRAMFAYADRDFEKTRQQALLAESLADDVALLAPMLALRAEALSESDDPHSAIAILEPVLARNDLSEVIRAHLDQAYAWAALLCDEPALLERGLEKISRCARLEPWGVVILIKQICLLAAAASAAPGRAARAGQLTATLPSFDLHGESRAYAALARGLAAAAAGDAGSAHLELAAAQALGVTPAPLRVLERRLASH